MVQPCAPLVFFSFCDADTSTGAQIKDMNNMLITASWDRTVRYWDLRQPNPVHTQQLPERVYAMDAVFPVLVVGLADAGRKIQVSCHCMSMHAVEVMPAWIIAEPREGWVLAGSCPALMESHGQMHW